MLSLRGDDLMNRYHYDLHVHSCLSPCADDDMTVNNIAGMAALNGLQIVALTDHNTCGNCPAFYRAAHRAGIIPVAGMELTTAEEIHMVCLFETLEAAMAFDSAVRDTRMRVPNRPQIFGEQWYLDEEDNVTGSEEFLLPPATSLSLDDGCALVQSFGGVCWPAHVDRMANGIIGILGDLPDFPVFDCVEYADWEKRTALENAHPALAGKRVLCSSDAHHLWDISESGHFLELEDEPYSSDFVRGQLFACLRTSL